MNKKTIYWIVGIVVAVNLICFASSGGGWAKTKGNIFCDLSALTLSPLKLFSGKDANAN